jgi:hypothetical protein
MTICRMVRNTYIKFSASPMKGVPENALPDLTNRHKHSHV